METPSNPEKEVSQEEVFDQVYEKYKERFPGMLHGSGGLPDTKGFGSSDVDICVFHENPSSLSQFFPENTEAESGPRGVVYKLKGYPRQVNIFSSNGEWWQDAFLHRKTELSLNERYPELSSRAYAIKKETHIGTEAAWAKVLGLGDDYFEILLDTEKTLETASRVSQ